MIATRDVSVKNTTASSVANPGADPGDWIPTDQAAAIMGCTRSRLRVLVRERAALQVQRDKLAARLDSPLQRGAMAAPALVALRRKVESLDDEIAARPLGKAIGSGGRRLWLVSRASAEACAARYKPGHQGKPRLGPAAAARRIEQDRREQQRAARERRKAASRSADAASR